MTMVTGASPKAGAKPSRQQRRHAARLAKKGRRGNGAAAPTNAALQEAVKLHKAGHPHEALQLYRKILADRPDQVDALNLGGVANLELNHVGEAVKLLQAAVRLQPSYAEAHNNLGTALKALGRLDDAVASYHKALAIKPDYAVAHSNLGNVFKDLGRLDDAVASYRKALAIKPDLADPHNNLGTALRELGRLDDAVASYRKALAIKPDLAEIHNNVGATLQELGRFHDALAYHRRAVALGPENDVFWDSLAMCLEPLYFTSVDDSLFQDLASLLARPTVHLYSIVRPVISALRKHPGFSRLLELTRAGKPETEIVYADAAESLAAIPLLLRIMEITPICDLQVERMLTFLRCAMIQETMAGKRDEKDLPFSAALALHCFTNEYVFSETAEEKAAVEQLQQQIAALVKNGRDVRPALVAALGAYRPLHRFSWAKKLLECEWTGGVKEVILRQIAEPMEEQSLRSQICRLTPIQDTVSQAVREQYEDNPYPRWIKTGVHSEAKTIEDRLRGSLFDLEDYVSPENPEILVAGCGTGQHALVTASSFLNSRVLAVDLSQSSLTYAMRKTHELGFTNIDYAQGDIMELGSIGRQFDLIECSGVLHHLGDPLGGWQVLVGLLGPGGLMKIALYSETARQPVVKAHALIAEKGYLPSFEDILRCRQDIVAVNEDPEISRVANFRDFFSLSECRDLLFHVQEHRFTLPRIAAALKSLKLKFLGFDIRDQGTLKEFKKSHPESGALTSLSVWHEFELKNPNTFLQMYHFWCRKI